MASTLSEQRRFISPRAGEDWNAVAARALPDQPTESAIQSLKSWNLHLMARVPSGEFLGCDVLFVEPPRDAAAARASAIDLSIMDDKDGG